MAQENMLVVFYPEGQNGRIEEWSAYGLECDDQGSVAIKTLFCDDPNNNDMGDAPLPYVKVPVQDIIAIRPLPSLEEVVGS